MFGKSGSVSGSKTASRSGSGNQPWFQARKMVQDQYRHSETVSGLGSEIRLVFRPSSESIPNLILGSVGLRKMTVTSSCRSVNRQIHPGNSMIDNR
jgi:hypothetical protein